MWTCDGVGIMICSTYNDKMYTTHVQDGGTALHIACMTGHLPVVRQLLQKHADIICTTVYYCVCNSVAGLEKVEVGGGCI